jgi:hypothetical protein
VELYTLPIYQPSLLYPFPPCPSCPGSFPSIPPAFSIASHRIAKHYNATKRKETQHILSTACISIIDTHLLVSLSISYRVLSVDLPPEEYTQNKPESLVARLPCRSAPPPPYWLADSKADQSSVTYSISDLVWLIFYLVFTSGSSSLDVDSYLLFAFHCHRFQSFVFINHPATQFGLDQHLSSPLPLGVGIRNIDCDSPLRPSLPSTCLYSKVKLLN